MSDLEVYLIDALAELPGCYLVDLTYCTFKDVSVHHAIFGVQTTSGDLLYELDIWDGIIAGWVNVHDEFIIDELVTRIRETANIYEGEE